MTRVGASGVGTSSTCPRHFRSKSVAIVKFLPSPLAAENAALRSAKTGFARIELIPGIPQAQEQEFYRRLERAAETQLEHAYAYLSQKQVAAERKTIIGSRAPAVANYAALIAADLIVVSTPKFNPDQPAASWGSLSWKIGFLAGCPVLLVK